MANSGHDTRAIQDYLGHKNIYYTVRYTQRTVCHYRKNPTLCSAASPLF
ncbi:tyrosine-type recombinase/integrase [Nostoc sp.]